MTHTDIREMTDKKVPFGKLPHEYRDYTTAIQTPLNSGAVHTIAYEANIRCMSTSDIEGYLFFKHVEGATRIAAMLDVLGIPYKLFKNYQEQEDTE